MDKRAIVSASLGFLTIAMAQRLMAMVFVLNFDVEGPNATAAMALLLVTAPAWWRLPGGALAALAGLTIGAVVAASLSTGLVAALGAAVALLAMTPLWRAIGQTSGAVVGALAWMTLSALLGLSPFHAAPWLVAIAALPLLFWVRLEARETRAPASLWMFLLVQAFWLASLASLWRWQDTDPTTIAIASSAGLAVGLWVRSLRWRWADVVFVIGIALSLGAFADLAPLGVFAAQVAAVRLLDQGGGVRRMAAVQVLAVVFLFLHVVAGNWAFVGFVPETLSRGLAGVYLFLLTLLLPVAAWRRA